MSKGAETKDRIVRESAALMNVRGFVATPISEILDVTGLKKGGLYNHFASRDEVAGAAFDYAADKALAFMREVERRPRAATEPLLAEVDANREYGNRYPLPGGCPQLRGAVESANGPDWLRERSRGALVKMTGIFERLLSEGRGDGSIGADVDPEASALAIVAALEGSIMLSNLYKSAAPASAALDMIERYIRGQLMA